jgi:hypothetical protein
LSTTTVTNLGGSPGCAFSVLGQVQPDRAGQQRRGDDEDHHQHQHHVHQRRDVDVAHGLRPLVRSSRPNAMSRCHALRQGAAIRRAPPLGRSRFQEGAGHSVVIGQQFAQVARKTFQVGLDAADLRPNTL